MSRGFGYGHKQDERDGEDYMRIPKTIRAHGFFTKLSKTEDIVNSLKINVDFLKEVNDNFK